MGYGNYSLSPSWKNSSKGGNRCKAAHLEKICLVIPSQKFDNRPQAVGKGHFLRCVLILVEENADLSSPVFSLQFLREWKMAQFLLCIKESKGEQ